MIQALSQLVAVLGLGLICLGLAYFFAGLFAGVRALHRGGSSLGHAARTHHYAGTDDTDGRAPSRVPAATWLYFIIPALNEAAVIAGTVRAIFAEAPGAVIVVVDDASSDGTAGAARAAAAGRVLVVERRLPKARLGKGPALNSGFRAVVRDSRRRGLNPDRVLVVVMDADGRLSVGATAHVAAMFAAEPHLGGVQLAVRIRNRDRVLTRMQDLEFWGLSALTQLGRNRFGTVGLGGNGQFSRLSALLSIGRDPWSAALTEDLDLGISLRVAGWSLRTTPDASVDQEGLDQIRQLLRQRTRWLQGHMTCARRIPQIWATPHLSTAACLELCLNLVVPWLFLLIWSVLIHLLYLELALKLASAGPSIYGTSAASRAVYGVSLYLLSFLPNLVIGYVYHRRDPEVSLPKGLAYGHLAVGFNYLYFLAAWRGVGRMLIGRAGWDKTSRLAGREAACLPGPERAPDPAARPGPERVLVPIGAPATSALPGAASLDAVSQEHLASLRHPGRPESRRSGAPPGGRGTPSRQRVVSPGVGRHRGGKHRRH